MKEIEEGINKQIKRINIVKSPYNQKLSIDSKQSLSKFQWTFAQKQNKEP